MIFIKKVLRVIIWIIRIYFGVVLGMAAFGFIVAATQAESNIGVYDILLFALCTFGAVLLLKKPKKNKAKATSAEEQLVVAQDESFSAQAEHIDNSPSYSDECMDSDSSIAPIAQSVKPQSQATFDIINATDYSNAQSIDDVARLAKERSDKLYAERQSRIDLFDPLSVAVDSDRDIVLTSIERAFLKKINKQPIEHPEVYAYWTYEYNIDFSAIMSKLLGYGFIAVSDFEQTLSCLTVKDLKELLAEKGISPTSRKASLIQQISSVYTEDDKSRLFERFPRRYLLTQKGTEAIEGIVPSFTYNYELEDSCLENIIIGDVNTAYKDICLWEAQKMLPRGIGIDWKKEAEDGLSNDDIKYYTDFLSSEVDLPDEVYEYEMQIKACCILAIFFGCAADEAANCFFRIIGTQPVEKSTVIQIIQEYQFELMDNKQQNDAYNLT